MEALIIALLVPALTGLTILAYKHHNAYLKLHEPIIKTLLFLYPPITFFSLGFNYAYGLLWDNVPSESLERLKQTIALPSPNLWIYALLVFGALWSYLTFLKFLPQILDKPQTEDSDHKDTQHNGQ